jgi:hypothetical protein
MIRRFRAVAKSHDTWHMIDLARKDAYKERLIAMYGNVCTTKYGFGCGKEFLPGELTIDHIIEIALSGPVEDIGNMELLCVKCHTRKTENYDRQLIKLD